MTTCDKDGCSNTFNLDNEEGVVITSNNGGVIVSKAYCSTTCRESV